MNLCYYVCHVLQQTQLQSGSSHKTAAQTNQELEINALATRLMNSAQQFQAAGEIFFLNISIYF